MKVELHTLNERLCAYVEFSVPLSVELIPRFFMPLFFAKLFFCSRPQRSWSFQTRYDTHGWPVIENTCHFEITKLDRLKFEKSSLAAPTRKIWIIEVSITLWSCQKKPKKTKKTPQDLTLISSRILIGFCWKESISGRIIPRGGSSLCVYGPVAHLQIGKWKGAPSTYDERPAAMMISLGNG